MQCEIRAMGEIGEGARSGRVSDTLPKPGRVNEVCKEWLVHEDGALAYQLQKEEVDQHYTGNKSRNAIIREDLPKAKDEQRREEEEAIAKYHQMVILQEEKDAKVAKQLAERIEHEEAEKRRRLELKDKEIALQIQEKEKHSVKSTVPLPVGDVNSVGLPLAEDMIDHKLLHQLRGMKLQELTPIPSCASSENWPPPPQPEQLLDYEKEEEYRKMQEQKDEELARRLQEQEDNFESIDQLDKDRLMAIEAQDKELARLLQERERAKAKRARERAKQRAMLKKQQQMQESGQSVEGEEEVGEWTEQTNEQAPVTRPANLDLTNVSKSSPRSRSKQRYPDPEEIEVLSCTSPLPNIAMAIDPTYMPVRHASTVTSSAISLAPPDFEEEDDGPVPPYMPIQGQRRTSSLEKKPKKIKPKDGCKQQ